ncbi:hypothetical protein JX265_002154 [Neoarthrinium moseri]|uniref:Uncharacterized protein n=1 Tax=Neoarthrinium moseri TaxID=1658444 RepID=A0A9P9WU42_9PEZI|nr:hypothetical protein JX265_002154 [Neoarthrinium moseri]
MSAFGVLIATLPILSSVEPAGGTRHSSAAIAAQKPLVYSNGAQNSRPITLFSPFPPYLNESQALRPWPMETNKRPPGESPPPPPSTPGRLPPQHGPPSPPTPNRKGLPIGLRSNHRALSKADMPAQCTEYFRVRFEKIVDQIHHRNDEGDNDDLQSTWKRVTNTEQREMSQEDIAREIQRLDQSENISEKQKTLGKTLLGELENTLLGFIRAENESLYVWSIAQIDHTLKPLDEHTALKRLTIPFANKHKQNSSKTSRRPPSSSASSSASKKKYWERVSLIAYFKRSLRPNTDVTIPWGVKRIEQKFVDQLSGRNFDDIISAPAKEPSLDEPAIQESLLEDYGMKMSTAFDCTRPIIIIATPSPSPPPIPPMPPRKGRILTSEYGTMSGFSNTECDAINDVRSAMTSEQASYNFDSSEDERYQNPIETTADFVGNCKIEDLRKEEGGQEQDEGRTEYTSDGDLSESLINGYAVVIAKNLFGRVGRDALSRNKADQVIDALPGLLKALALKIGYQAPQQPHRDVMVFIHRYRQCDEPLEEPPHQNINYNYAHTNADDEDLDLPVLDQYKRLVYQDWSYEWLIGCLNREISLSRAVPDIMGSIRQSILQALPSPGRISRRISSQSTTILYTVFWNVHGFLGQQKYQVSNSEALAKAVTITGSSVDAQALSCREYLFQTWPSTGIRILELVQDCLSGPAQKGEFITHNYDELSISMSINDDTVVVEASGIPDFVAEVGEQLAWIGAAMQPSPHTPEASCCTPNLTCSTGETSEAIDMQYIISFDYENCGKLPHVNGQCWHDMFNGPVIVRGYPIATRSTSVSASGLEAPLDLLAALARTRYIDTVSSKIFIKGFSTMLVPTQRSDGLILWHMIFNESPSDHIRYSDCKVEHVEVSISEVEGSRHVLGWCSVAECIVGSRIANFSILKSGLPFMGSCNRLDKISISAGKVVTGSAGISLGCRETPVHIAHDGYFLKLQWIEEQYFVFWDTEKQKGWLVNGARALLYILRATLSHTRLNLGPEFILDLDALPDLQSGADTASGMASLHSEAIRTLPVYVARYERLVEQSNTGDKTPKSVIRKHYHILENEVEKLYNILAKLVDHQNTIPDGYELKLNFQQHLVGWDMHDIITNQSILRPRVTDTKSLRSGWTSFTKRIGTVTLFGKAFGELIRPKTMAKKHLCQRWSHLPAGMNYLAACVGDLEAIMERHGDPNTTPKQLCDGVTWHVNRSTFQPCPCNMRNPNNHHVPVQDLGSSFKPSSKPQRPIVEISKEGAVIFSIPWKRSKIRDAKEQNEIQDLQLRTSDRTEANWASSSGSLSSFSSANPQSGSDISVPSDVSIMSK